MVKCSFCGRDEAGFRGMNLIRNDGSISYFCSSKCRKNYVKLERDRIKVKWTEYHRAIKQRDKTKKEEKVKN